MVSERGVNRPIKGSLNIPMEGYVNIESDAILVKFGSVMNNKTQ